MRAVPAIAIAMVLAAFAWHPAGLPESFAQQDKLAHLLGFALLSLSLRLGLPNLSRQEYVGTLLLAASAMELGQTFLPTRSGSLADLAADAVGAVLGFALADAWRQWRQPAVSEGAATALPEWGFGAEGAYLPADTLSGAEREKQRVDEATASLHGDGHR